MRYLQRHKKDRALRRAIPAQESHIAAPGHFYIATSTTSESILAHLEPLFNSRHVPTHQHLSILIALFYLTSKNRDTFFNEHEVAKKSECAEFIIKATSSRRKLFEAYLVLSKPATWSARCCELLLTHMPERVSEQFCLDIAAADSRVVVKWLDEQQAISLSFIVKLMQQLASRLDSNPSIFTKLESLSWEQNVSQLHPESFYKQFIQDIQAITADDFFINKSIDTILRGLKQLKEEFDPLITRLADGDRKEYLKTRLIETKVQALGIVFLLASSAKNPRLTANLYSVRLLNLRLTDRDQEPMVVCDKSTIGFKTLGFHF